MLRCALFVGLIVISTISKAQKEYSNWYFGRHCALSFNNGYPEPLPEGSNIHDGASISDSLGNLFFYTDGEVVYDRLNRPTPNGMGLFGTHIATQGNIIVKLPLSDHLYYLFNVFNLASGNIPGTGLSYSVFDIRLNNGYGDIIEEQKNIPVDLPLSGYALAKITAVRHKNNRDIWIITRNYPGNNFYSFLLSPEGLSTVGKISQSLINLANNNSTEECYGEVNISPDGTKLAATYLNSKHVEYGNFNTETGKYYPLFIFQPDTTCGSPFGVRAPTGLEFSPDSKLLYLCHGYGSINFSECSKIHQFDVSVADSAIVKQSEYIVGVGISGGLQTGPDGKIYGGLFDDNMLTVIHNPNQKGPLCNYSFRSVPLGNGNRKYSWRLPQMLQKYFSYINYTAECINQSTLFNPNIYPAPDSVYWNFGDASSGVNDTSTLLNTSHVYHTPGDYSVSLISYWPGGRSDTSVKVISVLPAPFPNIGDTAFICKGDSVALESDIFESYLWSSGDTTLSITVADTGTYWIEVINSFGCTGRDSVRVDYYPAPVVSDSVLISPTACGGSTGAIRGITATGVEPISVRWLNSYGSLVGTAFDISGLPVDWYSLWLTDGRGCTNFIEKYYIRDAGNVLIDTALFTNSYCGNNNGSITVKAITGLGDRLEYSINPGEWLSNEGNFTNLEPGEYVVKVRVIDSTGCQAVWPDQITISNEPGPVVDASAEPETDNNQDGTVTLNATGFGTLTYILENGIPQNNGYFIGLAAGDYNYKVIDENGCSTEGTVTVGHIQGFTLSAIVGNDTICLSPQTLTMPVLVENFKGVKAFKMTLSYDATKVSCEGYMSMNDTLDSMHIEVFPALERVVAQWTGGSPVTFAETELLFELVFAANEAGSSQLAWDLAPGLTWFEGENGPIEDPNFKIGEMQVNEPARVSVNQQPEVCEGDILMVSPVVTGTQPISYHWELPDGSTENSDMYIKFNAGQESSGLYVVKVTDALGCKDSITISARVVAPPQANFPTTTDTIYYEQQTQLQATPGYASYQWNTGDTTYFINVTEEGDYSVLMQTTEGCTNFEKVTLVDTWFPFNIPNAFTPNGDGLNDTFRPVTDYDRFSKFSMVIYNSWGQRQFETTNPAEGWDGKDAAAGVYSWLISYSNHTGKVFKMRGRVMLVR
ncbi:MAG: gliding motility-associated C-terminal domain-containing protein [Lentimicrobium sp.]